MTTLFLIPARGGSKGLPGKNLRHVAGMSLVARAVRVARQFIWRRGLDQVLVLVDTDAPDIAEEGRRWGAQVPFLRPSELAADATPTIESTLHALGRVEASGAQVETVALLQPTSPLRGVEDLEACWDLYLASGRRSAISVTAAPHPLEFAVRLGPDGMVSWAGGDPQVSRRQDARAAYEISGAVYITSAALLRERRSLVIPGVTRGAPLPAARSVDVDSADDLRQADAMARSLVPDPVAIGARKVGHGHPCFIVAEAGVNHNGDVALAHRLVDVAAEAGAHAVKFQTFDPDQLVAAAAPKAAYQQADSSGETQHAMLRRLTLPRPAHDELCRHAHQRGLMFLSTAFDPESADLLEELGVPAFKVPSGEITNHPFLAHLARKGRPLIISTGMSDLAEVAAALDVVEGAGSPPVVLLHCVTSYPAAPTDCNLRAMETMRAAFGVPTGWSDHTLGIEVSCAAAALGASLVEKHFTLDRNLPGPDHRASLEPGELKRMVSAVREIEAALGDGSKRPAPPERELAAVARRSLHAARDLKRGHSLTPLDLVALRPGTGIPPSQLLAVVGRPLRAAMRAGQMITEADLE